MGKPRRHGASKKKGGRAGTGGNGRQALEGKGPTPEAEDRKGHKAFRDKNAAARRATSSAAVSTGRKGEFLAPAAKNAGTAGASRNNGQRVAKAAHANVVRSGPHTVVAPLYANGTSHPHNSPNRH